MSDAERSLSPEVEPYQTQFKAGDDPDEVLWDVIDILAERANMYKVRWAGVDPKTGKPWNPSWVLKHDCTDDLIHEWKLKKAKKKKEAEKRKSARARASTASSKDTKLSASTSTTATARTTRHSTVIQSTRNPAPSKASTSCASPPVQRAPSSLPQKRRKSVRDSSEEVVDEQGAGLTRPRKMRKVQVEVVLPTLPHNHPDSMDLRRKPVAASQRRVTAAEDEKNAAEPDKSQELSFVPITKVGPPTKSRRRRKNDEVIPASSRGSTSSLPNAGKQLRPSAQIAKARAAAQPDAEDVQAQPFLTKVRKLVSGVPPAQVSSIVKQLLMEEEEESTQEAAGLIPPVPDPACSPGIVEREQSAEPREEVRPDPGPLQMDSRYILPSANDTFSRLGIVPPTQSSGVPDTPEEPAYERTRDDHDLTVEQTAPSTPVRSRSEGRRLSAHASIISKMKSSGNKRSKRKLLKPMPYLDADFFKPYLPADDYDDIEQFSSPEGKSAQQKKRPPGTQDTIEEDFTEDMMDYVNWDADTHAGGNSVVLEGNGPGLSLGPELSQPIVSNGPLLKHSNRGGNRQDAPLSPEIPLIQEYPSTSTTQRADADSQSQQPSMLNTQIAELNAVLEEKDEKLTLLESQIEELQTRLSNLESERAEERSSFEADLKLLRDASSEKLEQLSTLESQIVEMQLQLTQMTSDSDNQRAQYESRIRELSESLDERNEQVSQLEDALGELHSAIEEAQLENEKLVEAAAAQQQRIVSQHDAGVLLELAGVRENLSKAEEEAALHAVAAREWERRFKDAEDDRVLLRKLYEEASEHAQRLARENAELEDRAARAEGQVKNGLAMVRGTFEQQVKVLQGEAERWKGMHKVLSDRDARTDDEVRRRAALEPELQEENARLRVEVQAARRDVEKLATVVEDLSVKVGANAGHEGDEEDDDYVPDEKDDGSDPSSTSSSGSESSSGVVSSASIRDALGHSQSKSPDTEGDFYVCQHVSGPVMCNSRFATARDVIDHARGNHYSREVV